MQIDVQYDEEDEPTLFLHLPRSESSICHTKQFTTDYEILGQTVSNLFKKRIFKQFCKDITKDS